MPYAIELAFDQASEDAIKNVWQQASDYFGTDYMFRNAVTPHIALSVHAENPVAVFDELPDQGFVLTTGPMGFFAEGAIAYLAIERHQGVLAYHAACQSKLKQRGIETQVLYTSERWVPHITVAQDCVQHLAEAFAVEPMQVTVERLMVVSYPPTAVLQQRSI